MDLIYKFLLIFTIIGSTVNGNPLDARNLQTHSVPIKNPVKVKAIDGKEVEMNINPDLKFFFLDIFNNPFCSDACKYRSPGGARLEWNNKSPVDAIDDMDCWCRNLVPVLQDPGKKFCGTTMKNGWHHKGDTMCSAFCRGKLQDFPYDKLGYYEAYYTGDCIGGSCYCIGKPWDYPFGYTAADGNHL